MFRCAALPFYGTWKCRKILTGFQSWTRKEYRFCDEFTHNNCNWVHFVDSEWSAVLVKSLILQRKNLEPRKCHEGLSQFHVLSLVISPVGRLLCQVLQPMRDGKDTARRWRWGQTLQHAGPKHRAERRPCHGWRTNGYKNSQMSERETAIFIYMS